MELRSVSKEVLDDYVEKSTYVHYMKTSMWAQVMSQREGYESEFLGIYDGEMLKGTAMVLKRTWHGHKYQWIPQGPCLDYTNEALINDAFTLLKAHALQEGAEFLRTDPNVERCHRLISGEPVNDGFSMEYVTKDLSNLGYTHRGYGYAYDGSWDNRYTLIADLSDDMETVISRFSKQRRTSLNRHKISGVSTRIGSSEDLPALMEFERQLSEQDGFKPHKREFFEQILDAFGNHARLYVTEINLDTMIEGIENELAGKKYAKDPEARAAKEKDLSHARELIAEYGKNVPIAAGLFLYYGSFSWDLYTYNHKEFNFIKPVDNLHAFAMADMKSLGVLHYDMCGFSGVTSKDDPYFGLYNYKKSFGSVFTEHIGQFDCILNQKGYDAFVKEWSLKSRIRRKVSSIIYKKNDKAKKS